MCARVCVHSYGSEIWYDKWGVLYSKRIFRNCIFKEVLAQGLLDPRNTNILSFVENYPILVKYLLTHNINNINIVYNFQSVFI